MDSFNKSVGSTVDKFSKINKQEDILQKNSDKILKNSTKYNKDTDKTNKLLKETNKIKEGIIGGYEKTVESSKELVKNTTLWNKLFNRNKKSNS